MQELIPNGVAVDPRTEEQKKLDYGHEEYLGGAVTIPAIVWQPKTSWITLDVRKQTISTSCGSQAGAKGLTAFTGIVMSALPIFDSRSNFPQAGMYMQEIGSILVNLGTDTEAKYPSQNMTDDQLNAAKTVFANMPYKIDSYYTLPVDMDLIAQALEKGHAIVYGLSSNINEWIDTPVVGTLPLTFSHFVVTHSKNYLMWENQKATAIDDSCNLSSTYRGSGQRLLTESFIKTRVWGVLALVPKTITGLNVPHCSLSQSLLYGMMNNSQVVNLQDMLKFNGVMPMSIPSTGNFLSATLAAVNAFQKKYATEILTPEGLTAPNGKVGPGTIAQLKLLFP